MVNTPSDSNAAPDAAGDASSPSAETGSGKGFSELEKLAGVAAAYNAPLASSLVASALLKHETNPVRRRQLEQYRNRSLVWWVVGGVIGLVVMITIVAAWSSSGTGAGGRCRGGPDKFDIVKTTFQSSDGTHWTATYPCTHGGSTTVPVPKRLVPGE